MKLHRFLVALALNVLWLESVWAVEGDPVALRRSDGCFVIESMWNLSVQIVEENQFRSTANQGVDVVCAACDMPSLPFRFRQQADVKFDRTLDRVPNVKKAVWTDTSEAKKPSENRIRVRSVPPVLVVDVDGVRFAYVGREASELSAEVRELTIDSDVLIIGGGVQTLPSEAIPEQLQSAGTRFVALPTDNHESSNGNTLAIRADSVEASRRTVLLDKRPLTLPAELEQLMTAKENACRESQRVFESLSVNQMNFRPSNGSHTPRWNTEHMMGRELLFFSQIYHAIDPAIPVMDLNPKQMPPDYRPRHADWTGAEEARQMKRVSSFTSRFAYLLKDLPLDSKAPGSNWTPRRLLQQMDRHYGEHTANVVKKFDLEDWPKE